MACAGPAVTATAQDMSSARLLPGWHMDNGNYMAGIEIVMAPGWKTYWRQPGSGGIPPQFDWSGSTNFASAQVHWPQPIVFETYGVRGVGYQDSVVFPVEIAPEVPGEPLVLSLDLFYGICSEVCIPANAQSHLDTAQADQVAAATVRVSYETRAIDHLSAGVASLHCAITAQNGVLDLEARFETGSDFAAPYVVVETGRDDMIVLPAEAWIDDGQIVIETSGAYFGKETPQIDRDAIRMTLLGNGPAVEVSGCRDS